MTDATDPEGTARFKKVCELLDEIKRLESENKKLQEKVWSLQSELSRIEFPDTTGQ